MQIYKHTEITKEIIGCGFKVHNYFGSSFQEVIYQRALAYELTRAGVKYSREIAMQIFYKDCEYSLGTRRVDFLVEEKVIVELKAVSALTDAHMAQTLNYMKIWRVEVGLLINFGAKSMEYKRLILSKHNHPFQNKVRKVNPGGY